MNCSEMGPALKKNALRFFIGKYFSSLGGDFNPPHIAALELRNG